MITRKIAAHYALNKLNNGGIVYGMRDRGYAFMLSPRSADTGEGLIGAEHDTEGHWLSVLVWA